MKLRPRVLFVVLAGALALTGLTGPARAGDEPPTPALSMTADKAVYVAGQTAMLTNKITAQNLDWVVAVRIAGTSEWKPLCFVQNVRSGTEMCAISLAEVPYNLTAVAQLIDRHGTEDTADDTVEAQVARSIPVKVKIGTTPTGYYTQSGGYQVYPRGASPKYRAMAYPAFPGKRCLRHVVQRHYASGWKTIFTSACRAQDSKGQVAWQWAGKHASGVKFRLRATFAGDQVNRANASTWQYLRFR